MRLTEALKTVGLKQIVGQQNLGSLVGKMLLLCCFLTSCQRNLSDVSAIKPSPAPDLDTQLPPPPPPNSYLAQLPPDATSQLVDLGVKIVIPTYLTKNMTLANYGVGDTSADNGSYYWLVYRDDQGRCFAIEYAASGVEDISLENQEPLKSDLFGQGYYLYHGRFPNGSDGELPESDLFTDWLVGDDGFYRLIGSGLVNAQEYGQGDCENITVEEAMTVTESLSYLPTDIRTLELIPAQLDFSEDRSKP